MEPQAVGTLHRLELSRRLTVDDTAIVPHINILAVSNVASVCRGAGAEDALGNVHVRQRAELVVGGVVTLAVHAHLALAAVEALCGEVGTAAAAAPVGSGIDGMVQQHLAGTQGRREAARLAGLELPVGAVVARIGLLVGHTAVDGVLSHVHIHRAVGVAQVACTVEVALHRAAREVDDGRWTLGSGRTTLTLRRVAVVDVLRAAVERLVDVAAVHVDDLQAVDHGLGVATRPAGATEDVAEGTAVDVGDNI